MTDRLVEDGAGAPGATRRLGREPRMTSASPVRSMIPDGPRDWAQAGRMKAVVSLMAAALFLWAASSALAVTTHPFVADFGSFGNPQSVTTDDSGHVYVLDVDAGSVSKFDTSGAPVDFSALGSNTISGFSFDGPSAAEVAVDNSGGPADGDVYVVSFAGVDIYGADGTHLGSLDGSASRPADGGEPCGVATDPTGKVYVGYFGVGHVDRYVPASNPVTNADFDSQINSLGNICGLAADSTGAVYVDGYPNGPLTKYSATQFGGPAPGTTISDDARAVGIDPVNDDVYVARASDIARFDSTGALQATLGAGHVSDPRGVAVDPAGDVFVSNSSAGTVSIFGPPVTIPAVTTGTAAPATATTATLHGTVDPDGIALIDCHFEYVDDAAFQADGYSAATNVACTPTAPAVPTGTGAVAVSADLTGLVAGTAYHVRLVASNANGTSTGADQLLSTGPRIGDTAALDIGTNDARISASVDPQGRLTTYHVEYGTTTAYGQSTAESSPIGSDLSDHKISRTLGGLTPGVTYHVRVVATGANITNQGADLAFTTYMPPPDFAACPNDTLRTGPSARLPDCRAYEQASPVDKDGSSIGGQAATVQASPTGDAITFDNFSGLPGGTGQQDFPVFVARRGTASWSTHGLLPPARYGSRVFLTSWTSDLTQFFFGAADAVSPGQITILSRSSSDDQISTLTSHVRGGYGLIAGASADDTKVYFQSGYAQSPSDPPITADAAPGRNNLYLWDRSTDAVTLAGVLPDSACGVPPCTPPGGSFAGPYDWWKYPSLTNGGASVGYYTQDGEHAVSTTGDRVFFTAGDTGQVYVRENAASSTPSTVQVSASQAGADPNGPKPAVFMGATPNGSKAFFTSCARLTSDAATVSTSADGCETNDQGADLYAYDMATGHLTDVAADAAAGPLGADVRGVIGISDDGSYVYFAANGDLDGTGPATLGDCHRSGGDQDGTCNIYLSHNGSISFVAHAAAENWQPLQSHPPFHVSKSGRVSADGQTLVFYSQDQLTQDATEGGFFRYHFGDPQLTCVTCKPTGAGSGGGVNLQSVRALAPLGSDNAANVLTRNLSADGDRFFFETTGKLVAADTNGDQGCPLDAHDPNGQPSGAPTCQDVYEWEANGSGSCRSTVEDGGCLYLLSAGTSPRPSFFADASVSGEDAFVFTQDPLVPQDQDSLQDVYDVRVGGGLAAQHPTGSPDCSGDVCQGSATAPPVLPIAGSVTFTDVPSAPDRVKRPLPGRFSASKSVARGSSFLLSVKVPAAGRVSASGGSIRVVRRTAMTAESLRLRITLTTKAKSMLKKKKRLAVKCKVTFKPISGPMSAVTVALMVRV